MIRQDGDRGIGRDVPQAFEVCRLLWFRVDGEVKRLAGDGQNNRHDVRLSVLIYRRQASYGRAGKSLHRLFLFHPC